MILVQKTLGCDFSLTSIILSPFTSINILVEYFENLRLDSPILLMFGSFIFAGLKINAVIIANKYGRNATDFNDVTRAQYTQLGEIRIK